MHTQLRRLLFTLGLTAAAVATACPVCGQARNAEVNATYVAMTAFMSLTPLLMIFGLAFLVVNRVRKAERAEQAEQVQARPVQAPAASPPGSAQ